MATAEGETVKDALTEKQRAPKSMMKPRGCKCWNDGSWSTLTPMPKICDGFVKGEDEGICAVCEHNEECHP